MSDDLGQGQGQKGTKRSAAALSPSSFPTLVLDNGGYSMKVGFATADKPRIIPNCITKARSERRRPFIADQLEECRDTSGLFFILPFQKGYMVNADLEKTVWDYTFGKECLNLDPPETNVLITEPQFNFKFLQKVGCELLFEEYEFNAVARFNASQLSDYKYALENPDSICTLIVDSGYSFTHIVPYINGQKVAEGVCRIDVGGKALTNHLKEIVSYRQIHVLDETYLINQVKEDLCFVSTDFTKDMEIAKKKYPENTIVRDYVLPDYSTVKRGFVRGTDKMGSKPAENEQVLRMNNERFTIPELLFAPSDVGVSQMGIAEGIMHVIDGFPEQMKPHFLNNIVLTGGSSSFPGLRERVYNEIRAMASTIYPVRVTVPKNPVTHAWEGGCGLTKEADFSKYLVTKAVYNEVGYSAFSKVCDV